MPNLIEGIQAECNRIREHVLPLYVEIGPPGAIGVILIKHDIQEAEAAIANGDVVRMIQMYQLLKETTG